MGVADGAYIAVAQAQADAAKDAAQKQLAWTIAVSAANVLLMRTASGFQVEIAEWQLDMADEVQSHWEQFLPEESRLLQDVFGMPEYIPQYAALSEYYEDIVEDSFYANHEDFIDYLNSVCQSTTDACRDAWWQNERALQQADAGSYALRVEEQRQQTINDMRFAWQYAALGIGKGVAATLASFSQLVGNADNGMGLVGGLIRLGARAISFQPPAQTVQTQYPYQGNTARYAVVSAPMETPAQMQLKAQAFEPAKTHAMDVGENVPKPTDYMTSSSSPLKASSGLPVLSGRRK